MNHFEKVYVRMEQGQAAKTVAIETMRAHQAKHTKPLAAPQDTKEKAKPKAGTRDKAGAGAAASTDTPPLLCFVTEVSFADRPLLIAVCDKFEATAPTDRGHAALPQRADKADKRLLGKVQDLSPGASIARSAGTHPSSDQGRCSRTTAPPAPRAQAAESSLPRWFDRRHQPSESGASRGQQGYTRFLSGTELQMPATTARH